MLCRNLNLECFQSAAESLPLPLFHFALSHRNKIAVCLSGCFRVWLWKGQCTHRHRNEVPPQGCWTYSPQQGVGEELSNLELTSCPWESPGTV